MSFHELSHVLGASLFAGEGKQNVLSGTEGFTSVSVDSREVLPGALFVALKGAANDGHYFVDSAFKAGACGAMVALSAMENSGLGLFGLAKKYNRVLVAVDDTLKGLQNAAAAYLRQFSGLTRIGITGSVGKTTTKEIAAAIASQEKRVVMNEGNLNSETGLPLSVFNVRAHHELGIFEAAMNHPGEIADLAKILNPHIALITNIGSAHIGFIGSRQAIAEEKKQIFSEFDGTNTAMIPAEDDFRDFLAKNVRGRTVFYGASTLPAYGGARDLGLNGIEIIWDGEPVRLCLPGIFNLPNALAAAALAMELRLGSLSVCRGFESVKPIFGRGEIFNGRSTLIRDCYNSNPEGAEAVLDFCDSLEWPGRKIYVMGAMLEMGEVSDNVHAALGKRLSSSRADIVFLFGEEMRAAAEVLDRESKTQSHKEECAGTQGVYPAVCSPKKPSFFFTIDMGELSKALDNCIKKGDLVLLKGSRGYAMEELTGVLTGYPDKELGAGHVS